MGPAEPPDVALLMAIAVQAPLGQGTGHIPVQATIDAIAAALGRVGGDAIGRRAFVTVAPRLAGGVACATNFGVFDRPARPGEDRAEAIGRLDLLRGRRRSAQAWNLAALLAERLLTQGLRRVEREALGSLPSGAATSVAVEAAFEAVEAAFEAVEDRVVTQLLLRRRRRDGQLGRAVVLEWDEQPVPSNQPFVPCQPLSRVFVEIRRTRAGAADGLPDTLRAPSHGALGALALGGAFPARIPVLLAEQRPAAIDLFYLDFRLDLDGPLPGLVAQLEGREDVRRPCVRIEAPAGAARRPASGPTELTLRAVGADLRGPLRWRWRARATDATVTLLQPTAAETVLRLEPAEPPAAGASSGVALDVTVEVTVEVVDADGATASASRTIDVGQSTTS